MKPEHSLSRLIEANFASEVVFLQRLIRAKSTNAYTSETSSATLPVEAKVAELICDQMQAFGWQPQLIGFSQKRPNVFCARPGKLSGKTLILNAHMDTVAPSKLYSRDPFGAEIEDGRVYGVGAADAKAQIAALVYATYALELAGIALDGTLKLAFVVDEESGANSNFGTRFLLDRGLLNGDAALIGEPGDSKIAIGHRGVYRFRIRTRGQAVHTGLKEWEEGSKGHNAILDMAHIISALATCVLPERTSLAFPGRKHVLSFPTLITGGSGINVVPEACEAYGDFRLLPGLSVQEVRAWLAHCLAPLEIPYELQEITFVPAVEISPTACIVQALSRAVEEVTGVVPRLVGAGPACDGWMFIQRGIETICGYGVRCGGVHAADEFVDVVSLRNLTEIYARMAINYLGGA